MARYIDADALTDNFIRHYTEQERKRQFSFTPCEIKQGFADMICEAPTVDAAEVVRCRECKHWKKDVPGCTDFVGRCGIANYMIGARGFCLYGERR